MTTASTSSPRNLSSQDQTRTAVHPVYRAQIHNLSCPTQIHTTLPVYPAQTHTTRPFFQVRIDTTQHVFQDRNHIVDHACQGQSQIVGPSCQGQIRNHVFLVQKALAPTLRALPPEMKNENCIDALVLENLLYKAKAALRAARPSWQGRGARIQSRGYI